MIVSEINKLYGHEIQSFTYHHNGHYIEVTMHANNVRIVNKIKEESLKSEVIKNKIFTLNGFYLKSDLRVKDDHWAYSSSNGIYTIHIVFYCINPTCICDGLIEIYGKNIRIDKIEILQKLIEDDDSGLSEKELCEKYIPLLNI